MEKYLYVVPVVIITIIVSFGHTMAAMYHAPDLQVDYIALNTDNFLIVAISNQGRAEAPSGVGQLSIFVDNVGVAEFDLGDLADQTFRQIGGQTVVHTGIRLSGTRRCVLAFIDSRYEIEEEDEFQNTMSVALDAAPLSGHDFAPSAWVDSLDQLNIYVVNIGDQTSPSGLPIDCRVYVEDRLSTSFSTVLPALAGGGWGVATLVPPTPIIVTEPTRIKVACRTESPPDESDHANNIFEGILSYVTLDYIDTIYAPLLNNPLINSSMYWEDTPSYDGYDTWPDSMKDRLKYFLLQLEKGIGLPIDGPPPIMEFEGNDYQYIAPEDARDIYLAHVAQCLWFEKHNNVAWSITELSADELAYLFDSRKFLKFSTYGGVPKYWFTSIVMGSVTPCNPQRIFAFMKHMGMIKPTQEETVFSLVDWFRVHARHASGTESSLENRVENFGYKGFIPVDRIPYPLEGKQHISWGCWGTSGFFAAALRTVNIPVVHGRTVMTNSFEGLPQEHSRIELPTLRKSPAENPGIALFHSDDLYNVRFRPWGNSVVPSVRLFYTFDEISTLIDTPQQIDCRPDGQCNTPWGQATQNDGRRCSLIAREYLPGYYLKTYCTSPETLDGTLRGIYVGGEVQEFALPFLNEMERLDFFQAAQAEIEALGNGNFDDGAAEVNFLSSRFSSRCLASTGIPSGANRPPCFMRQCDRHVETCEKVTITLTATDPDGDQVTYTAPKKPAGSTLQGNVFEWIVGNEVGIHEVIFGAADGRGGTAQLEILIVVDPNPLDGDGDGLPDPWELSYFEDLSQTADDDPETDGRSNCLEYIDNTNPSHPDNAEKTYYVNASSGNDASDGLAASRTGNHGPKATIQAGIDATIDGWNYIVLVAPGTYRGDGNRDLDFGGKAITVKSQNGAENTIINCEGTVTDPHRGFYFHLGENLSSVVMGFTITNGYGYGSGGGIKCSNGSNPTILDCTITASSSNYGGAIACYQSSPTIANCVMSSNSVQYYGGAILCFDSSPEITNCLIINNTANKYGGAIHLWSYESPGSTHPLIANCTISGNRGESGLTGGILCNDSGAAIITNCILWDNVPGEIYDDSGLLVLTYCDIKDDTGESWFGTGCIDSDPLFVSGPLHDYYLSQVAAGQAVNSPCLDAGDGTAADSGLDGLTTRTDGNHDLFTVDMGYHAPFILAFTSITLSGNNIIITWNARDSENYYVQWSGNLTNWNETLAGGVNTWTHVNGATYGRMFYRVREK